MDTLCFPVKRLDHFMYPAAMFRTKERPTHGGLDKTPVVAGRSEPAYAIEDGVVVIADLTAEPGDMSGIDVMILGRHTGIRWWYGHLAAGNVFRGQHVRKGQHVGYTGSTGNSSGAHLHLEAHYPAINIEIDPWPWLWDAPDVDGSTMPLAPSRNKAMAMYPKYGHPSKPKPPANTPEQIEEEELMGAKDDIIAAIEARIEEAESRLKRATWPEPIFVEVGEDGTRYDFDSSPYAALHQPSNGFVFPLEPAPREGQLHSQKTRYRIVSPDANPDGLSEHAFFGTIADCLIGAGRLPVDTSHEEKHAAARALFDRG